MYCLNYEQLYQNIENTQYDTVHIASATKSVMALLIGIAVDKGYIESMDQYILEFFPEYQLKRGEKTLQQVQLKHLMTMTAPYKNWNYRTISLLHIRNTGFK